MKCLAHWCWNFADRGLGYSLCLFFVRFCEWVCSVWPIGVGVLQTQDLVIVCVCLCLVRVLRLGVKCVAKWCWSVADRGIG